MVEVLWTVAAVAFLAALAYALWRIEPHWVSKDGHRFTCNVQRIDASGHVHGRWREHRAEVTVDGAVRLRRRLSFGGDHGTAWQVTARAPAPPRGRAVFLLRSLDGDGDMRAIRLPAGSAAVDVLDALAS